MNAALAIALLLAAGPTLAGAPEPGITLNAQRVATGPTVDGDLSDPAWLESAPFDDLVQQFPDEATRPTQHTELRVVYDDRALYVAARCDDEQPEAVIARLTRRDLANGSDSVIVDLDTRGDGSTAYHFELSAAGVKRDGIRTGDTVIDFDWDTIWRAEARKTATGWAAEFEIPFTALRFAPGPRQPFRIQVRRVIGRSNEVDAVVYMPRIEHGEMLRYAALAGVHDVPAPHGVSLTPFGLFKVRYRTASPGVEAPRGTDLLPSVGVDVRVGLTSGLSLDATALPDFGQVDADPALLNLSTYETAFPERRPFFLEGADAFLLRGADGEATAAQLFYSRRVGRGLAAPPLPPGWSILTTPDVDRVWGAAKLTGRIGEHWSLGVFDGVSAYEEAVLSSPTQEIVHEALAALSNQAVAKLNFTHSGWQVGAALTDVRRFEGPRAQLLAGGCPSGLSPGASGRCTQDQTAAALDARWRSADGEWSATANAFTSLQGPGPSRMLRDGTVVGPNDLGGGGRLEVMKAAGPLVLDGTFETYSPRLDFNELGYLQRQNLHRLFVRGGWRLLDTGPFSEAIFAAEVGGRQSWDGVPLARFIQLNASLTWANFWNTWLELQWWPSIWDNREAHDGTRVQRATQWGGEWVLGSNPNRAVTFTFSGDAHSTWKGVQTNADAAVAIRPLDRLELSVAPTLVFVSGDPRWLETEAGRGERTLRFGLQRAVATGATVRSNFTLTPRMSLQLYAQVFWASVSYSQVFETHAAERAWVGLAALAPTSADPRPYREQELVLNLNVVFRWEYLPGSLLYFVFTRAQGAAPVDPLSARPTLDFGALAHGSTENVFLVKASFNVSR